MIGSFPARQIKSRGVVRQKASTARFDATHHGLPDAQCTMGLLLLAQWDRANGMILAGTLVGVNEVA